MPKLFTEGSACFLASFFIYNIYHGLFIPSWNKSGERHASEGLAENEIQHRIVVGNHTQVGMRNIVLVVSSFVWVNHGLSHTLLQV